MIEVDGDLWEIYSEFKTLRIIPTNGYFKRNGELIMGKGVALEAKQRYKWLPKVLGEHVKLNGNIVYVVEDFNIASFPTKECWWEPASIELIERSAHRLYELTYNSKWDYIVLPCVGCGNGQLDWQNVLPILQKILPESMYLVVNKKDDELI